MYYHIWVLAKYRRPDFNQSKIKVLYTKRGFTLVELMVAFSIFVVIIGLLMTVIVGGFRSFGQGQKMAQREQRKRFVFFRLGKEVSSLTRITYPGTYFKGDEKSFFLSLTSRIT